MDEAAIGDLIERIYDMALEPELWPALLGQLAEALGAHACALDQEQMDTGRGGALVTGADPAHAQAYFDYYHGCNVLRRTDNIQARMRNFKPAIVVDEETLPKQALIATEYYADFFRPADFHSVMTIGLGANDLQFVGLDIFRSPRQPNYDTADIALAERLHPHLIRAFRLSRKFQETRRLGAGLESALERSPYAVLIVDMDGRLRHANGQAERLLAEPGGLSVREGRLTAADFADAERLRRLIAGAGATTQRAGGALSIRRLGDRAALSVTAAPVRPERFALFNPEPGVVLCVTDPEATPGATAAYLREQYGLTPAQSKVAQALLQGRTPREAAEEMGLSFFTVRAHLAQVFEKTGVRRQAELVSLLSKPPPF